MEWNLKNAALFGFGILTTLGYGKIEPRTTQGRLFTVFYGFLGVPFTVIIFTNFGRYLQKFEKYLRKQFWRRWRRLFNKRKTTQQIIRKDSLNPKSPNLLENCNLQIDEQIEEIIEEEEEEEDEHTSPLTLIFIVILYLFLGAILIDWLDEKVDFPNGIYFAFLCLTAIEYGKLIPSELIFWKNFGILNRTQMGQTICHSKELVELSRMMKKFSCGLIQGLRYRPPKIEKP
ncbi:unnamed protein product [Meloidogyne enterolobii]|uniref:Uncharacterized protein n=1 Tax=Meloidogyne enterolobii TaxID=390850 RepID=A0ACB0ZC05_MELEN